ncbi:unnamed protein product [Rotaria sp. Silwood2]|nr:unnamed protein product [Rotaria sp. Silwood2]
MDPVLIRNISDSNTVSKKNQSLRTADDKQIQLLRPLPLGLLQNDRSTLTTNEWTLLSNFLHAFDEQNSSIRIQNSLNELCSLPPKLRLKPSELKNLIRELYSSIGPLIECSPDFHSLPVNVRQVLVKLYLYGFKEAALRFTRLVKSVLDLISMLNKAPQIETRHRIMDTIITETERTLVIGD